MRGIRPSRDRGEAGFDAWEVGQVATMQAGEDHIRNDRAPGRLVCSALDRSPASGPPLAALAGRRHRLDLCLMRSQSCD